MDTAHNSDLSRLLERHCPSLHELLAGKAMGVVTEMGELRPHYLTLWFGFYQGYAKQHRQIRSQRHTVYACTHADHFSTPSKATPPRHTASLRPLCVVPLRQRKADHRRRATPFANVVKLKAEPAGVGVVGERSQSRLSAADLPMHCTWSCETL